jgi:hypothetical protein
MPVCRRGGRDARRPGGLLLLTIRHRQIFSRLNQPFALVYRSVYDAACTREAMLCWETDQDTRPCEGSEQKGIGKMYTASEEISEWRSRSLEEGNLSFIQLTNNTYIITYVAGFCKGWIFSYRVV